MEERFQLQYHGRLSLFEQNTLTSEERKWWMTRLKKQIKEEQEATKATK